MFLLTEERVFIACIIAVALCFGLVFSASFFLMDEEDDDDGGGTPDPDDDDDHETEAADFGAGGEFLFPCMISTVLSAVPVSFIILYARISRKNAFDGIRKDIYEFIRDNPGEHFNAIMRRFEMSPNAATHHLGVLEYMGYVSSYRHDKYRRFYLKSRPAVPGMPPVTGTGHGEKHSISLLRNLTSRRFVEFVMANPGTNQKEIATAMGVHPSTVNWHASRLIQGGIVEQTRDGKEVLYRVLLEDVVRKLLEKLPIET